MWDEPDLPLSALGGGEGRGEVGAAPEDGDAAHLTLPIASPDGSPRSPPASGRRGQVPEHGRLLANLMHFARTLRAAGLPVGPGKVIDAVAAVRTVGITDRRDFYWTLHAVFVNRPDQRLIFDQAFHVFWRRAARNVGGGAAFGWAHRAEAAQSAPAPSAAGRAVRHFRLDEPLQPHLSAFHALGDQRPRPCPYFRVRDATDKHHATSAPPGC